MAQRRLQSARVTKAGPPTGKLEGLICSIQCKVFHQKALEDMNKKGIDLFILPLQQEPFNETS